MVPIAIGRYRPAKAILWYFRDSSALSILIDIQLQLSLSLTSEVSMILSNTVADLFSVKNAMNQCHMSVINLAEAVWVESEQSNAVLLSDASTW
jgi:hypothetical protein